MKRIVIIGGGISGLSTAYSLVEHAREQGVTGLDITLIERSGRTGGNIVTEKRDGFLIEGGPDCFLSEKPWAMELCKKLGLGDRLLSTTAPRGRTFVLSGGRLHLLPEGVILMVPTRILPFLTSGLITLPGKIRMGLELFVPRRTEKGDESLEAFVTRRLGREALDKIAEPLVAGVHAGEPETMSVRSSFPKFVEMEETHGSLIKGMLAKMKGMRKPPEPSGGGGEGGPRLTMFMTLEGGLTELVEALLQRLDGVTIKTGTAVDSIRRRHGGWEVEIAGGPPIEADAVVAATPAYVTSRFLEGLDDLLVEKLVSIPYVSTATVSIGYKREDIKHPLDGFGFVVPRTEKRRIMAATWSSVKWAGRAPEDKVLIRCFVGGTNRSDLVSLGDEETTKMVREELSDIMGIDAEPLFVRIFRWKSSMPQYTIGHGERIESIEGLTANHPGLYLTGSAYHGIGISDTVREAEATAKKVLGYLGG
ncbi:MAG: protoporphyrinogen oxidase [Thermodesulfobacteriota bacterium]